MPITRSNNIRQQTSRINNVDFSKGNAAAIVNKENQMRDIMINYIGAILGDPTNFLEYSDNNIELLQELQTALEGLNRASIAAVVGTARTVVGNLLNHIETVKNATDNVTAPENNPNLYIGTPDSIDLTNYFETTVIPSLMLTEAPGVNRRVAIKTASGRNYTRNWTTGVGNNLNINGNNLDLNIIAGDIPGGLNIADYPLTVELDLFAHGGGSISRAQTSNKIKINIKEPVNVAGVLGGAFTGAETYQAALNTRLDNYYNTNAEDVVREYILERINKAGGSLSDTQKDILVDHLFNDPAFVNGDTDNAYTSANLQAFFPTRIEDESVGGDNGYRDMLRDLLINPDKFNQKSKEVFLDRMRDQRNNGGFILSDDAINQQVNELIQEQATNSIGNITNGALPGLLGNFSAGNNRLIRHQNRHRTGFRGFKKILGIFKGKKRRKLTDISSNNYFSFMSGTTYNINDEANVAGRKINQNIKIDMNSRNNISASIKVTGDEEANFEFSGASSIYELITGILGNNQVGAVTKTYLVFNIYKQFFQKMQKLFGDQDITIGGHVYNIQSADKLVITQDGNDIFNEDQFRNLESAIDLQSQMTGLATNFNTIMGANNQRYIRGMTTKRQNKFKIGNERVGRILRKRRNADFNFKTEVEGVNISYENKLFTVTYDGQEIKANKIETILSHKIFEGKQVQIMKAIYKEFLNSTANDPKAQRLLDRHHGIGFVVPHNGIDYIVSTQGGQVRFGTIPAGFPPANIDRRRGILTGGMYTTMSEDEVLSNPELASVLIHRMRMYRRRRVRGVNYGT